MSESYSTWPMRNISDIAQGIYGGGTPSREVPAFWDGGIPWVTPGELTGYGAKYLSDTVDTISQAGLMSSGARLLPANTVLVTSRATLGNVALAATETTTNQGFRSVILRSDQSPDYWYHYFTTLKPEMERKASGTTFLEISGREFAKLKVPVPPLPEQRRIAEILDALDDQIRLTEATRTKLTTSTNALAVHLLSDSEEIPVPLVNLCQLVVDCPHSTPNYLDDGVLVARTSQIRDGWFDEGSASYISEQEYARRIDRATPQPGDLILTREAPVGEAFVIPDGMRICLGQRVMLIRVNADLVIPEWLLYCLYFGSTRGDIDRLVAGTTNPHLNVEEVKRLPVAPPPITQQANVVAILNAARRKERALNTELAKLRALKAGLMDDLLSGKVRVVDKNVGGG